MPLSHLSPRVAIAGELPRELQSPHRFRHPPPPSSFPPPLLPPPSSPPPSPPALTPKTGQRISEYYERDHGGRDVGVRPCRLHFEPADQVFIMAPREAVLGPPGVPRPDWNIWDDNFEDSNSERSTLSSQATQDGYETTDSMPTAIGLPSPNRTPPATPPRAASPTSLSELIADDQSMPSTPPRSPLPSEPDMDYEFEGHGSPAPSWGTQVFPMDDSDSDDSNATQLELELEWPPSAPASPPALAPEGSPPSSPPPSPSSPTPPPPLPPPPPPPAPAPQPWGQQVTTLYPELAPFAATAAAAYWHDLTLKVLEAELEVAEYEVERSEDAVDFAILAAKRRASQSGAPIDTVRVVPV